MSIPRPRLSHFLVISLALHAAVLLVAHNDPPPRGWMAGPVIVRLMPVARSTLENREDGVEMAAPTAKAPPAAAEQTALAAEKTQPQRRPAGIPAAPRTATQALPATAASTGAAEQQITVAADSSAELEQKLLGSLHAALMPHFSYPMLARRRGWEGIVRVGVRIEANGSLTRLHLVEPSPYDVLNTAAINSLARLARLPNAGAWLQGRHFDLILPVEYRLQEG